MSKEDVFEKVTEIFREVFMDDSIVVTESTNADDIEEWDSLMQMTLLVEIEKKFGMKFAAKEAITMQNAGEMVDIILSRI